MKLLESRRKSSRGGNIFSGKVRVSIQGLATSGYSMTSADGMPSKSFTIDKATVEEIYNLFHQIIVDVSESYSKEKAETDLLARIEGVK